MSDEFDARVTHFFKQYQDRGMKKWTGFFLSDHTVKLKRALADSKIAVSKPLMPQDQIEKNLLKAFSNHQWVEVHLKTRNLDGNQLPTIAGFVQGYEANCVFVANQAIVIDEIGEVTFATMSSK